MRLLFVFLLFFSSSIFSQEGEKSKTKIGLGLNFSPGISSVFVLEKDKSQQSLYFGSEFWPVFSFSLGLRTDIKFKNWVSLNTGLDIVSFGVELEKVDLVTSSGQPDPSIDFVAFKPTVWSYDISIPILVNFYLGKKKVKFLGIIGVSPSFGIFSHGKTEKWRVDGSSYSTTYTNRANGFNFRLIGHLGAGIVWDVNDNFSLQIAPMFKTQTFSRASGTAYYLDYSVSCDFSFYYYF